MQLYATVCDLCKQRFGDASHIHTLEIRFLGRRLFEHYRFVPENVFEESGHGAGVERAGIHNHALHIMPQNSPRVCKCRTTGK